MLAIMVLLWAFTPGELVMKNGKLLAYQGEYKVEDGYVKFTSTTGSSLQLPVSAVDLEKTKARDAALAEKKPAVETRTRSEREFQALVEDTPGKRVALSTRERATPQPVDTIVLGSEDPTTEWPKELVAVNVYNVEDLYRQASEDWADQSEQRAQAYADQRASRQFLELKSSLESRYANLVAAREALEQRMSGRDTEEPAVTAEEFVKFSYDENGNVTSAARGVRVSNNQAANSAEQQQLARIEAEIRQVQEEARVAGISLGL